MAEQHQQKQQQSMFDSFTTTEKSILPHHLFLSIISLITVPESILKEYDGLLKQMREREIHRFGEVGNRIFYNVEMNQYAVSQLWNWVNRKLSGCRLMVESLSRERKFILPFCKINDSCKFIDFGFSRLTIKIKDVKDIDFMRRFIDRFANKLDTIMFDTQNEFDGNYNKREAEIVIPEDVCIIPEGVKNIIISSGMKDRHFVRMLKNLPESVEVIKTWSKLTPEMISIIEQNCSHVKVLGFNYGDGHEIKYQRNQDGTTTINKFVYYN